MKILKKSSHHTTITTTTTTTTMITTTTTTIDYNNFDNYNTKDGKVFFSIKINNR